MAGSEGTAFLIRLTKAALLACGLAILAGCALLPQASWSDVEFAEQIHSVVGKLPISGIYELRVIAQGGHVTLGGRVDSPVTLQKLVIATAAIPGVCELSFMGMEFCPLDIPDEVIVTEARRAAAQAVGTELVEKLEFYCEDHFLIVHGVLPSLAVREQLDEAMRNVPGVGKYHVSCEVVLEDPPSDEQVVAAVYRKFRNPFSFQNLLFRANQIQVTSEKNVVVLHGRAPILLGKLAAGAQAAQAEGVRYVVNRIGVPGVSPSPAGLPGTPAAEAQSATDTLNWSAAPEVDNPVTPSSSKDSSRASRPPVTLLTIQELPEIPNRDANSAARR